MRLTARFTILCVLCIPACYGARLVADVSGSSLYVPTVLIDYPDISSVAIIHEGYSYLVTQGTVGGSLYAMASFGKLGASAMASLGLSKDEGSGASGVSTTVSSSAGSMVEDLLQPQNLAPNERLYIDVQLDGVMIGAPTHLQKINLASIANVELNIILGSTNFRYYETPDGVTITGSNYSQIGDNIFRIWTSSAGTGFGLLASLRSNARCFGSIQNSPDAPAAIACMASADYGNTLRFLGAGVSDSSGNALGELTGLVSQSGFDYIAGVDPAPTGIPEPGACSMISIGLAVMAGARWWNRRAA